MTSPGAGADAGWGDETGIKKFNSAVEGMGAQFGSWMFDKTHPIKNEELVALNKRFHDQEGIIESIEKQAKIFQSKLRAALTQISEFNTVASSEVTAVSLADSSNRIAVLIQQAGTFVVNIGEWKTKLIEINKVREVAIAACFRAEVLGDPSIEVVKRQKVDAEKVRAENTPVFAAQLDQFVTEFGTWRAQFADELTGKRTSFLNEIQLKEVDLGPVQLDFSGVDGAIGVAKEKRAKGGDAVPSGAAPATT